MIFERPAIFSDHKKIFKTHTHSFTIKGTGFPTTTTKFRPALKFEPALKENVDYTIRVIDRTTIEITLADTKAWRNEPGPLYVTGLNTRGDDAGWIDYSKSKIYVAEVTEDTDAKETGGVQVIPYATKVYQSTLKQSITISGSGFSKDISFEFDPQLTVDKDYTLSFQSENKVDLKLKSSKKWRAEPGSLIAKSVTVGGKKFNLAQGEGIRVAVVLADPVITPSKDNYHETQSKLVVISGSGFTTKDETKITLNPTISSSYKVLGVLDDQIRLQLKPDKSWSSTFGSLKGEDDNKKYTLSVTSIDTGAGLVSFDEPIAIGYIVKDREGVTCDDSCELAFDGICDDGSEPNDEYYYQNYVYGDDDLGGYNYGEEDEEGEGDGEETYYDDYDMPNEDYKVSGCVEGTDCTDCGGVDAIVDYSKPLDPSSGAVSCTNTCIYPRDGVCDDPRGTKMCALGTDCQDCGPVGADNFTSVDDDAVWDDDDDYWGFDDGNFLDQTKGLEHNRHKVKKRQSVESAGPAAMFLVVLEGMVYTVGAIFAAAALYLLNRWYKGQSIPFMNVFNPDLNISAKEFEMRPHQRMPITPDEFRT
ncbi:hypothetical protein M1146_05010 [Patescibacteria group bacterium]|nr:hypothetical protein [Patescibacteria group bacterium]